MSEEDTRNKKPLAERVKIIVGEAKAGAEDVGESVRGTLEDALAVRKKVVMVRLNEVSVDRLDDLVESGVAGSRSEAAAYLIGEGITANQGLFDRIADKIGEIRKGERGAERADEGQAGRGLDSWSRHPHPGSLPSRERGLPARRTH